MLTNESVAHLKNADPLRAQITPKLERLAGWAADVGVPVLVLVARLLPEAAGRQAGGGGIKTCRPAPSRRQTRGLAPRAAATRCTSSP